MTLKFYTRALYLCVVAIVMVSPAIQADENSTNNSFSLTLGIPSQQAGTNTQDLWEPLIKYIQQQTSYPVSFSATADMASYENNLFTGNFDFAYVNPLLFFRANRHVGYFPILKEGDKKLSGIIVVAKNSSMDSITDLVNKNFVSPQGSFAASAVTRLNLQSIGVRVNNSFAETYSQAYSLVASGSVDAAGGEQSTFDSLDSTLKDKLKILWISKGVAPFAFIVHPRVNATVKDRIVDAILSFKETEEGQLFYKNLHLNPFASAKSSDWDDVRQLLDN